MTQAEFDSLKPGDLIRLLNYGRYNVGTYVVVVTYLGSNLIRYTDHARTYTATCNRTWAERFTLADYVEYTVKGEL